MENNQLVYRGKKKQSLDDWVNEFKSVVYGYTYVILIEISHVISDVYSQMDR